MLVKCVCSNCGHSFLTDDQAGDLTCPRCGFVNDGAPVGGFDAPPPIAVPPQFDAPAQDPYQGTPEPAFAMPSHFDPKAPPPMFMSWDRMFRGMVLGSILTVSFGAAIGAALAATGMIVPGVAAIIMAFGAGAATRQGMGGRAARRTRGFAIGAVIVVVMFGFAGIFTGSWLVERFTGSRASMTRKELDAGKKVLTRNLARANKVDDLAERSVLETRLKRVERLEAATDAQIEDYLWVQEAQINQALLAYAKLRATRAPLARFGPDREPIEAPKHVPTAILGVEFLLAIFLASQGVKAKR